MVMTSTEVPREAESTATNHSPLLSIVVPVYNGRKKIESTLQKLKTQVEMLDLVLAKLEARDMPQKSVVYSERKVIENAGAAILLDKYFTTHSTDVAEGVVTSFDPRSFGRHRADERTYENNTNTISPVPSWYEIIVVNDGSKDDTRNILDQISLTDQIFRLISYPTNMGKGYAIKQGILHSRGKYVMFMDGDGEINSDVLSKYLEYMNSADIVIGSKYHPLSVVSVPASRRFFSKCFHLFVKVMLGVKVSDTQVGLKAGNGDIFRKIFQRVLVKRYAFDAEMLAVADILGLRVVELPVKIDLDRSFKKKEIVKMALDVLKVAFRLRVVKWYQKNMEKKRPSYRGLMFA